MIYEEVVVVPRPFDEVVAQVRTAFAEQGFGVLTEIDLQATLREKVGVELDRYLILGTCNPHLSSRAVAAVPQIGVLLPCNVVVRDSDDGVVVEAMDPGLMANIAEAPEMVPIADEARALVAEALMSLMPGD